MTQEQLAEYADLSNAYISRIERGHCKIPMDTLASIAIVLGRPIDYFVLDTPIISKERVFELDIDQKLKDCDKSVLDSITKIIDVLNVQHQTDLNHE